MEYPCSAHANLSKDNISNGVGGGGRVLRYIYSNTMLLLLKFKEKQTLMFCLSPTIHNKHPYEKKLNFCFYRNNTLSHVIEQVTYL